MPTVTHTFTWESDQQGFSAGLGGFGTWTGVDGSDFLGNFAPGCMDMLNNISQGNNIHRSGTSWEDLGVPHGATVQTVSARLRLKWISIGAPIPTNLYIYVAVQSTVPLSQEPLWSQNHENDPLNTWMTLNGSPVAIPAGHSASNYEFTLVVNITADTWRGGTWEAYVDSLEMTITYLAPPIPISMIPRTYGGAELVRAGLSKTVTPNGGSQIFLRASTGGLARVYASKLRQALFEIYFAGATNLDDFTRVAYSQPTPVEIDNPEYGQERVVDLAANEIVDLAHFLSGYMGNVKLRRAGNDGTYTGNIVFRGMTIKYKKRQT